MRSRGSWISVVLLVCAALAPNAALGSPRLRIALLARGSWSWFADPRAVRIAGRGDEIFLGWIDWPGVVTIGSYDPDFGRLRAFTLGHLFHDDHGAPAILVEADNRLTVFWSAHNGSRLYDRGCLTS